MRYTCGVSTHPNASLPHTDPRAGGERAAARGVVLAGGLLAATVIGFAAPSLTRDGLGIPATTVVLSQSPAATAALMLGTFAALTVIAAVVGRSINAVVGLFVLGWGLMVFSMAGGNGSDAIFLGASMRGIGVETLLWGVVTAVAVVLVFRWSGALLDIPPRDPNAPFWREYFDLDALRGGVAGLLLPVTAWFVVRNMMKGQAIGGAFLGGIAVGLVFRLAASAVQPVLAFIAPILLTGVLQIITAGEVRAQLDAQFAAGSLSPLARMMPLDIVSGALIGVAIGVGWARSFKRSDTMPS